MKIHFDKFLFTLFFVASFFSCTDSTNSNKSNRTKYIDSVSNDFWVYYYQDQTLAENSSRWCISESRKIKYQKGEAEGLSGVSIVLEQKGLYDSSIYYNSLALYLWNKLNDKSGMVKSFISLARNHSKLDQFNQQRDYLERAISILITIRDTQNLIDVNTELGIYYSNVNVFDSAQHRFKEALNLAAIFSNQNQMAITLENYGNILNLIGQKDSALLYYRKCIPIYVSKKAKHNLSGIYNNIALIFWNANQRDSVRHYLEKGYNETLQVGNKEELENYLTNMIDYWEEEPDLKKSNAYLHELVDLKDSVFKNNLEDKIAGIEKDFTVKLKNEENEKLKSEIKRKNTVRNAAIILAILIILLAIYQFRIYRQKRNIAEQEKKLQENEIDQLLQERELKNMDALLEGRETERKRIGRDLHDRLGSILSTVKLHFSAIDDRIDSLKKENQVQYHKASALLDEAVGEVRKIAQDLVSGVLVKYGLSAALNDMKNTLEATGKININLFEAGTSVRQNLEFEIAIYRIVQELISNILKHAEATKTDIHLTKDSDQFTLIVEDNGKGFDPENPEKFGMGMANIRQRVAALGGVVSFDSKPGAGATVIIEIANKLEKEEL